MSLFHNHHYVILSAKIMYIARDDGSGKETGKSLYTSVIMKCDGCGKLRNDDVEGNHAEEILRDVGVVQYKQPLNSSPFIDVPIDKITNATKLVKPVLEVNRKSHTYSESLKPHYKLKPKNSK
jgi:hypothetical protein